MIYVVYPKYFLISFENLLEKSSNFLASFVSVGKTVKYVVLSAAKVVVTSDGAVVKFKGGGVDVPIVGGVGIV